MTKLKFILAALFALLYASFLPAQELPVSLNRWGVSVNALRIADHSLSNQLYTGPMVCLHGWHSGSYSKCGQLTWEISDRAGVAPRLINPSGTNLLNGYSLELGYGTYWNMEPKGPFRLKVGCVAEASGGWKNAPKFMNNSLSVDGRLMFLAAAGAGFFFKTGKYGLGVAWTGSLPVAGVMFVPAEGMTVSEVAWKGAWAESFHFASFHNCQGVKGSLALSFHTGNVDLSLALLHNHLWWKASGVQYHCGELGIQLGLAVELSMHRRMPGEITTF